MNILTQQDRLKGLQDYTCKLNSSGDIKMAVPELQAGESYILKDTQAYENYLFSLSIMFL